MKKLIIALIVFIPSICYSSEWVKEDTALQLAYTILHVADCNQTLQITQDEKYYETNKILGKKPHKDTIYGYFAFTGIGHYFISRSLDQPYRKYWQLLTIWVEQDYVRGNIKQGFNLSFKM